MAALTRPKPRSAPSRQRQAGNSEFFEVSSSASGFLWTVTPGDKKRTKLYIPRRDLAPFRPVSPNGSYRAPYR